MTSGLHLPLSALVLLVLNSDIRTTAPLNLQIVAGGKLVWTASIQPGEEFDLAYEHSREHSTWIHHYVAMNEGSIHQVSSTFSAFGAGMPLTGATVRTAAGFTIRQSQWLGELRMLNWRPSAITLRYRRKEILIGQRLSDFEPFVVRVR